jgi:hypothetical protein
MGLIHPQGIFASYDEGAPQFRLASAMEMKKKGVRFVGGEFAETDVIECVRTGIKIPAQEIDGILAIETSGSASDIEDSVEFRKLVKDIDEGIASPVVEITPYLKGVCTEEGESNRHLARLEKRNKDKYNKPVRVYFLNESKLTPEERSQLYCRRFAYCDTNMFKTM